MNRVWHEAHPMPKSPTVAQRMAWHMDHARHCGCRPIPAGILALMAQRKIAPRTEPARDDDPA